MPREARPSGRNRATAWTKLLVLLLVVAGGAVVTWRIGWGGGAGASGSGPEGATAAAGRGGGESAAVGDSQEVLDGDPTLLSTSGQHLVAVVDEPGSTTGRLHRYERRGGEWHAVGTPVPIVVGRSGVGPKREGDGRSPRGVFPLGFAFGYPEAAPVETDVPYRHLPPESVCVDDGASERYNQIVFQPGSDTDWESAEAMRRDLAHGDDLYALGVTVEYNPSASSGAGSCIFLHIWRGPESPTAGCTAMPEEDLRSVLGWLQPREEPILVQGSRGYLEELRSRGFLPYEVPS